MPLLKAELSADECLTTVPYRKGRDLLVPCPIDDGSFGPRRRVLTRRLKNRRSQQKSAAVTSSGAWLLSRSHFEKLDLTQNVRDRRGNVPANWPVLVALRGSKAVYGVREWDTIFTSKIPPPLLTRKECAAVASTPIKRLQETNAYHRRLMISSSQRSVVLIPFDWGNSLDTFDLQRFALQLCHLSQAFDFVVVGVCESSISAELRRFIARTSSLASRAVQYRVSTRGARLRGDIVVLTLHEQNCDPAKGETGISLLRMAQNEMRVSHTAIHRKGPGFRFAEEEHGIVAFTSSRMLMTTSRKTIRELGVQLLAQSCIAILPSTAIIAPCNNKSGIVFELAPGGTCRNQRQSKSPPKCHTELLYLQNLTTPKTDAPTRQPTASSISAPVIIKSPVPSSTPYLYPTNFPTHTFPVTPIPTNAYAENLNKKFREGDEIMITTREKGQDVKAKALNLQVHWSLPFSFWRRLLIIYALVAVGIYVWRRICGRSSSTRRSRFERANWVNFALNTKRLCEYEERAIYCTNKK